MQIRLSRAVILLVLTCGSGFAMMLVGSSLLPNDFRIPPGMTEDQAKEDLVRRRYESDAFKILLAGAALMAMGMMNFCACNYCGGRVRIIPEIVDDVPV